MWQKLNICNFDASKIVQKNFQHVPEEKCINCTESGQTPRDFIFLLKCHIHTIIMILLIIDMKKTKKAKQL